MSNVEVAPEILRWAIDRSGREPEALSRRFPKLDGWLSGHAEPTLRQLQNFAAATYTPFGYFFLAEPPQEELPIRDFRTRGTDGVRQPSADLLETIYLCQARQAWFEEFAREEEQTAVRLVGSLTTNTAPTVAAAAIRTFLRFDQDAQTEAATWTEALRLLTHAVEEAGILVMASGIVGNNNHRKLDPEEFRGFALAHPTAPLLFVNGADSKAAQMFTIAHELGHLALGESILSDAEASAFPEQETERWCNEVAAEFLVPMATLRAELRTREAPLDAAARLARRFKVSTLVILRRLYEAGAFRTRDQFWTLYRQEVDRLREMAATAGGGDFYRTLGARVSRRFEYALVASAAGGRTTFTEAMSLLGFKRMATLDSLAQRLGISF